MQTLHIEAPAKINAYLEITGRRADGYHTILTHMQAVTLCDKLTMTWQVRAGEPFSVLLTCSNPALACDDTNLICRAAWALVACAEARGIDIGGTLSIALQKNIPMAAGLAGGSADAAATLRGFNRLLDEPFSTDELCEIGVRLGADIPFCIRSHETGAMTARGIGEVLTPAVALPSSLYLVIACHGEGVSTPWAYRRLDENVVPDAAQAERTYANFLLALDKKDAEALSRGSRNCFERVVLPERQAVPMLMETMRQSGAIWTRMSGSGPSVVGFFEDESRALHCTRTLQEQGIAAHLCRSL